jgi:hypothetical protein
VLRDPVAVDGEADLCQEMLASIVGNDSDAGNQALGHVEECLLEGCAWVG